MIQKLILEDAELLLIRSDGARLHGNDVEVDSLAKWTALANLNDIALLDNESWAAVGRNLRVPLLETLVLGDPVEIVTTDDNGAAHLGRHDNTPHKTATDRNLTCERALSIDILALDSTFWGCNAETDSLVVTRLLALATIFL